MNWRFLLEIELMGYTDGLNVEEKESGIKANTLIFSLSI